MDYHSLPRKQLQALCKKHDIPANQTNVQMADALTTLLKAEGKPKSDANAGRMQNVRVESGKENSNVPKISTRSNKEPVKSTEGGVCEENVASVEDAESNEGVKVGKTRGRGLPKLVPESKEPKDEIDGNTRQHCRGSQRERAYKNSVSDFSTVDVTSKKMDKKTIASEDEAVGEKAIENIEGQQSLRVEETSNDQENHGKHLRHPRKKTMPEEQTKPKVVDVGTKRSRAGKATHHPDVATELSVKDVDVEQKNVTNKAPVIIDIVDSDDEEAVNGAKDKADIVDVSVEPTVNLSEPLEPVVTMNASISPKRLVTRKGHKGGHKKEEVLKTSSEEVKVNAVCISVEPASNSSVCLKKAVTLKGKKEEKEVTASFEESKIDTVHVSDEPAVKQRGQKGGRKEKSIVTNSIEEANNIVPGVPVEAIMNDSGSPKRVITRKGCKPEHKKEMLQTSSEEDKVDAAFVSAEPTTSSLKFPRQIATRRGQKLSQKEEMQTNASSEEEKIDVVNVSDGPALNQRGRKGGRKGELVVANSVVEAKNIVTDVPVEATVHASESPKGVVTRKGCKGEQKKEVLKTGSEEDKSNVICVSVEPTSTSVECLKQVVSRRGQKCSLKEEKLMNVSSEEDKIAVINVPDEPTVNQRGRKGSKKGELFVTNSIEEAKNTITDVPVEATVDVSESPKGVVTRKGRKGEHKEDLKTGCEEDKFNAVCVSNEPMSTSLQCLKQVVTRRRHKSSHNEEKAVNASSEDVFDVPAVNRRGRRVGQKKESVEPKSSQEVKNIGTDVPVEVTVNVSKSTKQVVARKGCKGEHKKGELLKTNAELTMNSSESPKEAVTQKGVKCGELLVNDTIKESKNDTTDISVEDNASASESPERLVHEKVLDTEEGKTNTVSIPVKPTVKCSENLKHVVTRRGRINKQEGSKVVTVISRECRTAAVLTDSIEEVKNNATDISVEDNVNCSQPSRRVVTQQESKVGSEEVVNASAKDSNVFTRRGRINRQEEVLETDCVEEAKNNTTDIPVETSLNFEDDASIEVTGNTSLEHVNASPEEIKVDASGMSDESIQGQGESSSKGNMAKAGEIVPEFVDSIKQSSSACEVDIDSVVNEGNAHELRDSSSCEEEDLNDVKEIEPCLDQDVEISEQRTSHGDSAREQEGGDFDVDNLNESLGSIEEETNQSHDDSAHEQEDGEIEKKPDKVDASLDLAAKDESLEEQTMAGSTVFIDSFLDQSLESLEKDSNLLCEAGLEFSVDEEDPHELRDFSSCEEDNFYDVKEKEIGLIQDLEISQERAAYGDSFNDQEDGDFEKCPENVYCWLDSAAKGDDALEEQIEAGDGMIAASTVFVDNILDSVDSLKKGTNLPCEVDIDSAVDDEGAHELKDSSSCEDEDLNDAKEKELCPIQDVEISQQKASHVDSTSDQEDGDFNVDTLESIEEKTNQARGDSANDQEGANFEKEPDNVYTCSDLAAEDEKASWEQTMAGSIVFIDNMLDDYRESAEKDSKLPREASLDSAVNEEDAHKSRDSSSSEEGNFNAKEDGASEEKSERVYTRLDLAEKRDDALEEQTMAGDGMIAGSIVYVDNILDKPVESQEKDLNFPCELDIDSTVYEDDAHGFRDSCIYEENGLNDVIEKELVEMSEQKVSNDVIEKELVEMSEQKVSHGDSASDKEDGDFEKKSEEAANSSSLTAKDDDTMEEQTLVGDAMIAGSTVFADNILDNSVELLEIYSNLPCEVGVVSAVNEESAHELRDFSSCEEGNFNYVQGKELHLIQDLERSQQKISYDDSASVQENGDFEMKSEKFYTSSDLAAKDDEALEEKTMASKGMIAGSIVFVDNMLGESVESQDKIFNLQCEAGMDVAVNEEDVHESSNSSSTEEDNTNDVNEIELNMIGGVDLTHDEDEDSGECQSGEISVGKDGPQNILSYVIEEASLSTTPLKKFEYAGSSNISYFSGINGSAVEESRETLPTDCQSDASIKISEIIERQKELWTPMKKIEFTTSTTVSPLLDNPEEMPEITKGQVSPHLNLLFEEDTQSKKSELTGSTNITPPSSVMDDSATEWSQEDCMEEDCNLGVPETDSPPKTLVIEKSHKESLFLDTLLGEGSPKKCELIHSNAVPHSGMDNSVTKQSEARPLTEAGKIELFEFDCTEDSEFSFSPCLNIFDTPLKNPMLQSITVMPISSGKEEDCELGVPEIDSPSKMLVLEKGHDECLFLDTLFGEGTPAKKCELINANTVPHSTMDDSAIEQSEVNPRTGACKMELYELNTPSKISNGTKDDDFSFSPCLNIFDTPLKDPVLQCITDMSICSVGRDSDIEKGSKILTEASKNELSQIDDSYVEKSGDRSPFLNTLFVDKIVSTLKNSEVEHTHGAGISPCGKLHTCSAGVSPCGIDDSDVLPAEACKLGMSELSTDDDTFSCLKALSVEITDISLKTPMFMRGIDDSARDESGDVPLKMAENTEYHDRSPCLETLFVDDKPLSSGMDNSTADQTVDDLPIEDCRQELAQLDDSSKMAEVTKDQDRSPGSNIVFLEGIGNCVASSTHVKCSSAMKDSILVENQVVLPLEACKIECNKFDTTLKLSELTKDGLPTEDCRHELAQLDASSKMSEVTKDQDRSPGSNIVFLEGIGNCVASSTHVKCSSAMKDSILEENQVVLPLEACKIECNKFDTTLKLSELTKDASLSPCLNMDSVTVLEISKATNGTDISICSGGTDSGLHKMLEIHRTEDSKHRTEDSKLQMALVRQGSSTSSEMPKLADIDGLLQCEDIDIYAPEQGSEILPIDSHLKMGHDNPSFQSRQAVDSDLTKLSLGHLRRLYKEKQMKRKKSGKVIRKHPAFGEESQQDCKTQLECNVVTEVNKTLNKPEVEASEKLDKPEEFHQKSPAENDHDSLHRSPAAGAIISENMFGEIMQDCKTDIRCNNDVTEVNTASAEDDSLHVSSAVETIISENGIVESQEDCKTELHCSNNVSQVNIVLADCEIAEGSEKLNKPEEFSTGSNYVLPQTAPVEIGLPEVTSSYRASPGFNSQPSKVYPPMSKPELAEACDKPDKLDEDGTSLKKSKDMGDHDLLCESPASRIVPSETVHADERNGLALDEKPSVPNNSVESGLYVEEHTVCKEESRIPKLVDRLKILNDRLQSLQSNLQGLGPESTYATPLRKAMNCKSIGSAKKNRIPMSVGRFSMTSTKENPTDRKTPLSLKKDQRSYNENQIKAKDSEKVVGKRPALRNLSLNVLEERDQTTLHIHEED